MPFLYDFMPVCRYTQYPLSTKANEEKALESKFKRDH